MKKKSTSPLRRVSNWPILLAEFLLEHKVQPFEWGRNDCCLFPCNWILRAVGVDPAKRKFRGKYADKVGALRILKQEGGVHQIAVTVCKELGFKEIKATMAQRGDIVELVVKDSMRCALGICDGERSAFPGKDGIVWHPTLTCRRAWAMGRTT